MVPTRSERTKMFRKKPNKTRVNQESKTIRDLSNPRPSRSRSPSDETKNEDSAATQEMNQIVIFPGL